MVSLRVLVPFLIGIAIGFLLGLIGRPERTVAVHEAGRAGATVTNPAAPGETRTLSPSRIRSALQGRTISLQEIRRLANEWTLLDPVAAAEYASQIRGHDNREIYIGEVFRTWGAMDGPASAKWASENLAGAEKADCLFYAADGWAEIDPEGLVSYYLENVQGIALNDGLWEAFEAWGRKDPPAALEASKGMGPSLQWDVMDALAEGWGAVEPARAAEFALSHYEREYGDDFLKSVATQWAGSDPTAAAAWGSRLLNEAMRETFLSELGNVWALTSPEESANWAVSIEDQASQRWAMSGVLEGWAEHDPMGALDWVLQHDAGRFGSEDPVFDVVAEWTYQDPSNVARWIESQPEGQNQDRVISAFSQSLMDWNPRAAILWAQKISEPEIRESVLSDLASDWVAAEGRAAIREIGELGIEWEVTE